MALAEYKRLVRVKRRAHELGLKEEKEILEMTLEELLEYKKKIGPLYQMRSELSGDLYPVITFHYLKVWGLIETLQKKERDLQ